MAACVDLVPVGIVDVIKAADDIAGLEAGLAAAEPGVTHSMVVVLISYLELR